jgi:hypothetical protein
MTEDVPRNAFEPFFTTKPPRCGSGLGLNQVYGVARLSGGGVRIARSLAQARRYGCFYHAVPPRPTRKTSQWLVDVFNNDRNIRGAWGFC